MTLYCEQCNTHNEITKMDIGKEKKKPREKQRNRLLSMTKRKLVI